MAGEIQCKIMKKGEENPNYTDTALGRHLSEKCSGKHSKKYHQNISILLGRG